MVNRPSGGPPSGTDESASVNSPLRLFLLVALTMCAFAANSILNRLGVNEFNMDPMDFATLRVAAGASVLVLLVMIRGRPPAGIMAPMRLVGAAMLAVYMLGFSWAYVALDAGVGALILFGVLQVVIFSWAVLTGQSVPATRWWGACIALLGLCILLWPSGQTSLPLSGSLAMIAAGVGWAIYTLLGRSETDALAATAGNFVFCLPFVGGVMWFSGIGHMSNAGIVTACVAGALTSGLGYALWYRVLPQIPATVAGVAQLSVPVLALVAGTFLLSEPLTSRLIVAAGLVLGGIALSLARR